MIIDSHCHLDYEPMINSLDETVARALKNRVELILTISVKEKSYINIKKIIEKFKCVYGTYGIHPHEAKNHLHIDVNDIKEKILSNEKFIGIGETGLDFFYNHSEKNDQIDMFNRHIEAAALLNKPLIIHSRSAENEMIEIMTKAKKKFQDLKFLIHCFTGSKKIAFKMIDLGGYISASGIVTFKKSKELSEIFKEIPNDKILVETDAPYLSPEPLRGKSNEPSFIIHTINFLSKLKKMRTDELEKVTSQNFNNLFGIR